MFMLASLFKDLDAIFIPVVSHTVLSLTRDHMIRQRKCVSMIITEFTGSTLCPIIQKWLAWYNGIMAWCLYSFFGGVVRVFCIYYHVIFKQRQFYLFLSYLDAFYSFFFAKLLWLVLPVLCWIKVRMLGILVLSLILEEKFSAFHCWVWC